MIKLRHLVDEEKVSISAVLLDKDGDIYPLIHGHELLSGPTKVIFRVHQKLLHAQQRVGSIEKQVKELTDEMTQLDGHHDRCARGIYRYLEAGAELADEPEEEQVYTGLDETLFPKGLAITQRSYREQAGTAKRVKARLTDEERAQLESMTIGGKSLWDIVEDWLDTAITIARLQAKRAQLQSDDDDDSVSAAELHQARLEWIRAIRTLVDMMDFADLDEDDRRMILANIKDADRASERARLRTEQEGDVEADTDSETDEPEVVDPA